MEHQLPASLLLQAGYVGGEGHHLFDKHQVNLINPVTGERPLPEFSQYGLKANDGNNNFNALQVMLMRRFSNGFLFQSNYMWSHGITDSSIGAGESVSFQNMSCRSCDRSNSNIDVRHTFTLNAVYQLPFGPGKPMLNSGAASHILGGWEMSGIASARTGLPVNISMTRKASQMLDGNTSSQRPNLVPGESIYAADQTISQWFNPAAFSTPAKYTWGNLGRYAAFGPGNFEVDLALQKRFRLTEKYSLDVCLPQMLRLYERVVNSPRQVAAPVA